ncbi:MAG: hypothetical protein KC483_04325 [Nitrosarchaeum sp.]|nr:hypothetical protein [Nitrosarchaeum sp.]
MTRPGYYSEENKKKCYLNYISHVNEIKSLHRKICEALEEMPKANFELAELCDVKESTICGRINELKEAGFVASHSTLKHKNSDTGYECVCWVLTNKYHEMSGDVQTAINF